MTALICDVCGGTLAMDASGEFAVCESCGMKHSKERVKVKVQEIQGTVKIDGAVETVKGDAEKERLIKNAETFLNIGEIEKAKLLYEKIIDDYPDDYRGWLGLLQHYCQNIDLDKVHVDFHDNVRRFIDIQNDDDLFTIVCNNANVISNLTNDKRIIDEATSFLEKFISDLAEHQPKYLSQKILCCFDELGDYKNCFENYYNEIIKYKLIKENFEKLEKYAKYLVFKRVLHNDAGYYSEDMHYFCDFVFRNSIGLSMTSDWWDHFEYKHLKISSITFKEIINECKHHLIEMRKKDYLCQHCGGEFKGVFNKVCSKCGKPKDY